MSEEIADTIMDASSVYEVVRHNTPVNQSKCLLLSFLLYISQF